MTTAANIEVTVTARAITRSTLVSDVDTRAALAARLSNAAYSSIDQIRASLPPGFTIISDISVDRSGYFGFAVGINPAANGRYAAIVFVSRGTEVANGVDPRDVLSNLQNISGQDENWQGSRGGSAREEDEPPAESAADAGPLGAEGPRASGRRLDLSVDRPRVGAQQGHHGHYVGAEPSRGGRRRSGNALTIFLSLFRNIVPYSRRTDAPDGSSDGTRPPRRDARRALLAFRPSRAYGLRRMGDGRLSRPLSVGWRCAGCRVGSRLRPQWPPGCGALAQRSARRRPHR